MTVDVFSSVMPTLLATVMHPKFKVPYHQVAYQPRLNLVARARILLKSGGEQREIGRYSLKMNPLILLGACSSAGTITAALRAVQEEAQSKLPALGYTVPYALGNILLTAWGPVIVAMMIIDLKGELRKRICIQER